MNEKILNFEYFANSIDSFIDEICTIQLNPDYIGNMYINEYKNIVIILEEIKINFQNKKYADFSDGEKVIERLGEFASANLWVDLRMFFQYVQNLFIDYLEAEINDYLAKYEPVLKIQYDVKSIIEKIVQFPNLFGEFINYFLNNGGSFKDMELIEIEGFTAEKIMKNANVSVITAYIHMANMHIDNVLGKANMFLAYPVLEDKENK